MTETSQLDPHVNAYRDDLADASLQPLVKAAAYTEPSLRQCIKGVRALFAQPDLTSQHLSDIRYGEFLDVFEEREDGFAWVQNRSDHMVGYLECKDVFSENIAPFSKQIDVLRSHVYAAPSLDALVLDCLTLGSYIAVGKENEGFLKLASGGYIAAAHSRNSEEAETLDYAFTAGRLMGVPYLKGGRTPLGLDPAGLVQIALEMAGIEVPRKLEAQKEAFGQPLDSMWQDMAWRRGDLLFFENHVAIITGSIYAVHADPHKMQVVVSTVEDLVDSWGEVESFGRP